MKVYLVLCVLLLAVTKSFAIWCYQCTAATPGCSEPFNWRGVSYLGNLCPEDGDICIKLIERKGAQKVITRDCLSNFKAFRTDIPADTYEGCRPAAKDVNLANYVNNTIKELDIKRYERDLASRDESRLSSSSSGDDEVRREMLRNVSPLDWYDETTWCFCFLDHRCNSATLATYSMAALILPAVLLLIRNH